MDQALEAAEFLARSENRVAVLFALEGASLERAEVMEATDTSQVTVGRILADFEERGWLTRADGNYKLTAIGAMVAESLASFLDALDAGTHLQPVAEHLPTEAFDFELARLASATIIQPGPADPNAAMRTAARQVADSDHLRVLTHGFSTLVTDVLADRVEAGEVRVEAVFAPEVYEAMLSAPDVTENLERLLAADDATLYRTDGEVPHILAIFDDGLGMGVDDDMGRPVAVLDVSDAVVRDWAIETFEHYRSNATEVAGLADVQPTTDD